jgi:hypothetical protein
MLVLGTSGCYPIGAKPEAMIPERSAVGKPHSYSVTLLVKGGQETDPLDQSRVSNEAFIEALRTALRQGGVFSDVVTGGNSDYQLEVIINNIKSAYP